MERNGASFADALTAAQAEGYAEADPSFDVDGVDAAHKLSILAALCFGTRLDIGAVTGDGIRGLIADAIGAADAERKGVVEGQSGVVRVTPVRRRDIKKK